MANEPFAQFLQTLVDKYSQYSTFINNPENIIIGESCNGLISLPDSSFPRLEILIIKLKYDGYTDQRIINQSFRFSIAGHIKRDYEIVTPQDMFSLIDFGTELTSILFSVHNDVISGISPCDGFIKMGDFPEVFFEHETFPKTSSVILVAEAEIQLIDTYTNN